MAAKSRRTAAQRTAVIGDVGGGPLLVGLYAVREMLKPKGVLLIETAAAEDCRHSYANFARFFGGGWWEPSALCLRDLCAFMGFVDCEIRFYGPLRSLLRAVRSDEEIPFRRGLNWSFDSIRDRRVRTEGMKEWAPAPWDPSYKDEPPPQ